MQLSQKFTKPFPFAFSNNDVTEKQNKIRFEGQKYILNYSMTPEVKGYKNWTALNVKKDNPTIKLKNP